MVCQVEPLFIQYEIKCIVLLICRPLLTDELNHAVDETNQLLDCVGLEICDGTIRIIIFLETSVLSNLYGIPCDHKVSVIKNTFGRIPISGSFVQSLKSLGDPWGW